MQGRVDFFQVPRIFESDRMEVDLGFGGDGRDVFDELRGERLLARIDQQFELIDDQIFLGADGHGGTPRIPTFFERDTI